MEIPGRLERIEGGEIRDAEGERLDRRLCAGRVAWRGAGDDMGVSARRNPVRLAVAGWEWGNYYGKNILPAPKRSPTIFIPFIRGPSMISTALG